MSAKVLMYCTSACPFCQAAERLLEQKGAAIEKVRVDLQPELRAEMTKKAGGRRTVPQIWIAGRHVGGCDDLYELDRKGELDPLLKGSS
jgi:glutaredoxin 3